MPAKFFLSVHLLLTHIEAQYTHEPGYTERERERERRDRGREREIGWYANNTSVFIVVTIVKVPGKEVERKKCEKRKMRTTSSKE